MADMFLLKCSLNRYIFLVCVLKDFALPLVLLAYSWTHKERHLSSACIFIFPVRKFSEIAVKVLLQEIEELGYCRASVCVRLQAAQISSIVSRIAVCDFLQLSVKT